MTHVSLAVLVANARSGNLVSFPTDTVPALAVRPDKSDLIFEVKQRQQDKPLILMGGSADDLWPYSSGTPEELKIWQAVADKHWPGALTLVLPASKKVDRAVNPNDPTTIGLRVPDCAIARLILAQTGPLATTSANLSGQPPLETMAEIESQFPDVLTLFPSELESIGSATGLPSTVIKWTDSSWQILRQGAVKIEL